VPHSCRTVTLSRRCRGSHRTSGVTSATTKQIGTLYFTLEVLDTKVKTKGHSATQGIVTQALSIPINQA